MMPIPISLVAAVISLTKVTDRPVQNTLVRWRLPVAVIAIWGFILAIQLAGLISTFGRGAWIGTIGALVILVGSMVLFVGWRAFGRAALVLAVAAALAFAMLQWPGSTGLPGIGAITQVKIGGEPKASEAPNPITINAEPAKPPANKSDGPNADGSQSATSLNVNPTSPQMTQRFASIKGEVSSGFAEGRGTIWKVSWRLIRNHPWIGSESLGLPWLRPLVGYGPDLFRFTYLMESPPKGTGLIPEEPDHAHNYFIHQTVEQGILGLLSLLAVFAAAVLVIGNQLLRRVTLSSDVHKLVSVGLLAVLAGRGLEMMVGTARVSDLTVFWVLLGVIAALPVVRQSSETPPPPASRSPSRQVPPRDRRWLWRLAMVTSLVAGIVILTWIKGVNYPRAAMQVGEALGHFRAGDGQSTLANLERAIELAPDVPVYYMFRADVYSAYLKNKQAPLEEQCSLQKDLSYRSCLATRAYLSNKIGSERGHLYYRSRLALADSAFTLGLLDEAVQYYRETLELIPASWGVRNKMALTYNEKGEPKMALVPLKESLGITKSSKLSIDALHLRAMGQYQEAIYDLDEAISLNPVFAQAYVTRALARTFLAQDTEAQQDVNQAVRLGMDRALLEQTIKKIKQQR